MTTKAKTSVTDDIRAQLSSLKGHKDELRSEKDELSYLALIDKEPKAIARLAALNEEIRNLIIQIETNEAALKEATKRENAAAEAERAEKRKANVAAAAEMLLRAEDTAALLTKAMDDMRSHSLELQRQFAEIRGLVGVGATDQQLRVFLTRCVKTATMNTPMHLEHLAPNERTDVNAVVVPWAASIRNWINSAVGEKPAKAA
jgi:chromosome segregation ATPase